MTMAIEDERELNCSWSSTLAYRKKWPARSNWNTRCTQPMEQLEMSKQWRNTHDISPNINSRKDDRVN